MGNGWGIELFVGLVVLVIGLAVCASWTLRSEEERYLGNKENGCSLVETIERPDLPKVYCGKACFRPAKEKRFYCIRENKELIILN